MRLYVDNDKMIKEFINNLHFEISNTTENLKVDIQNGLNSNFAKSKGKIELILKRVNNELILYLKANSYIIADNYGTGSKMDMDNPQFSDYADSETWNDLRSKVTRNIVGRRKGTYTDFFGKTRKSSGSLAGINLEGRKFKLKDGSNFIIEAMSPSHAIEYAIDWYFKDWLPSAWRRAVRKTNFSKFIVFR